MKKKQGFTLIELMIVVAIIGILAGIAYPSYQDSVRKSRRADAKGALLGFANAMERHFTETNSYCGAGTTDIGTCLAASGAPTIYSTTSPIDGGTVYYNLTLTPSATTTVTTITPTTYNLRATPTGAQAGDGILEINSTEAKGRWDRNNDGDTNETDEQSWD